MAEKNINTQITQTPLPLERDWLDYLMLFVKKGDGIGTDPSGGNFTLADILGHSYSKADIEEKDTQLRDYTDQEVQKLGDILRPLISEASEIESFGSNFIRFKNGLQICAESVKQINVEPGYRSWESVFYLDMKPISFPKPFIDIPVVVAANDHYRSGLSYWVGDMDVTTTAISKLTVFRPITATPLAAVFYIAFGKWR